VSAFFYPSARFSRMNQNHSHRIIWLAIEHPDESPALGGERLNAEQGLDWTPETFRKNLQRARDKLAESIVEEVRKNLDSPTDQEVKDWIVRMGMYPYVAPRAKLPGSRPEAPAEDETTRDGAEAALFELMPGAGV
jgi:hypothetical protein